MRRLGIVLGLTLVVGAVALGSGGALAAPPNPGTNWGKNVNASQCEGTLVINVTHDVVNDGDSGIGRYWAYDSYRREIQVWDAGDGALCAVVRYAGRFTATAGSSPGGTGGSVPDGLSGTFEGGYTATITGTLKSTPAYPTTGYVGSFDYGWGGTNAPPPTPFSWPGAYLESGYSFAYGWWGWVYHGGACGTWYNTDDGNAGDISC